MTKLPFLYITLSLSLGIVSGHFADSLISLISILSLLGVLFFIALILSDRRPNRGDIFCLLLISVFGSLYYEGRTRIWPQNHVRYFTDLKRDRAIMGDVSSLPERRPGKTFVIVTVQSIIMEPDTLPLTGRIRVTLKEDIAYGERVVLYGRLRSPPPLRNPGGFDYRSWLARRDIYGIIFPDSLKKVGDGFGNRFISIAGRVKDYIRVTIDRNIGGNPGAFLKGITIRERGGIPPQIMELFRDTGVIHILAVSGLHVGIITGILFLIVSLFRLPNLAKIIIVSLSLILYAVMIDLHPSVVRATIMSILFLVCWGRKTASLQIVSVAAFIILVWNPQALFDVSFQFSFGAVMGIIYLYPKIYQLISVKNRWIDNLIIRPFVVSLSAQLGVTFLVAHHFYRLPVIALIANLFVIPLTGFCILTGFLLFIVNLLGIATLTGIFASAAYAGAWVTLYTVQFFGMIPYGHFWIGSPSLLFLFFYFFLLITGVNILYSFVKRKLVDISIKPFIVGVLLALVWVLATNFYRLYNERVSITFIDAGMSNSTVIELGRDVVLIDCGRADETVNLLRSKGINDISLIFLTSPLSYNSRGLTHILENFRVKGVALPFIPYRSWGYRRLLNTIKEKEIPYQFIKSGDRIGPFRVKNPGTEIPSYIKDASLVLSLNVDGYRILWTGEVENIGGVVERADIMKAPYFGGKRDPYFLDLVKPDVIVVSVGRNRWGLPNDKMIEEYKKHGRVIRTDRDGACLVRIERDKLTVRTMREPLRDRFLIWAGVR